MKMRQLILLFVLGFFSLNLRAQDTLLLKLLEADNIFLKQNLILLSQQYNIDVKDALILQAKAYPNPIFSADVNAYDPSNNRMFHVNQTGQKAFAIEQIIVLGGKRRVEIDMAKQNKQIAEAEFSEMLRNLKLQLHNTFYTLHQLSVVIQNYSHQLKILDTIINSYQYQADLGNIPVKDVIRLKSVYLKINTERSALSFSFVDEMKKMQLLLQNSNYVLPQIEKTVFDTYSSDFKSYDDFLILAMQNRPDLKIAEGDNALAMLNYTLQKKMMIPDVTINASYDQRGGAFNNQWNTGISIPLPVWNQNRGNIKAAEADKKSAELYLEHKKLEVQTDVQAARQNMLRSIEEYQKIKLLYTKDFESVFEGVNENFQKRNITILEFVDFFEAYNESIREFERIKTQLAISAGQINCVTASPIY
ncbi:MAG: TolC family protein [Flavobacteriales bacterium]